MIDTGDLGPSPAPIPVAPVAPVVVPVTPTPLPYPVPVPAPKPTHDWSRIAPWVGMTIMLASFIGWEAWHGRTPGPNPTPTPVVIDATAAGKAWAKELPLTFADSFEKAQADVRSTDKPLSDIRKEHVERWKGTREAAFDARFEKMFDSVIAPGNDKPSMEDRRRYAEMMGQIITGTREGAK